MTKHAPGPWVAFEGIIYPAPGDGDGDDWIADLRGTANAEANARLIAAAPDMLEALRGMLALVYPNGPATREQTAAAWDAARAALAKAEGEAA